MQNNFIIYSINGCQLVFIYKVFIYSQTSTYFHLFTEAKPSLPRESFRVGPFVTNKKARTIHVY